MHYIKISTTEDRPETISQIAGFLKKGRVVVLPTDTIYGFSCLADHRLAIKRIYKLKRRSQSKPFIILVSSLQMARKYAQVSAKKAQELKKYWLHSRRPTTVILKGRGLLPVELTGGSQTLALRLPKSDFLIKIIKKLNRPIVSTSLNLSGQANIFNPAELALYWPDKKNQPEVVVDAGRSRRLKPSRLIDLSGERVVVIRKWD